METPFKFSAGSYVVPGITWLNTNAHSFFASISGSVEAVLAAVQFVLTAFPAGVTIAAAAILAWALANWRVSELTIVALGFCWACCSEDIYGQ